MYIEQLRILPWNPKSRFSTENEQIGSGFVCSRNVIKLASFAALSWNNKTRELSTLEEKVYWLPRVGRGQRKGPSCDSAINRSRAKRSLSRGFLEDRHGQLQSPSSLIRLST